MDLGSTATVRYLLPFILDEVDDEIHATCTEAIDRRQTIAHQGQRDVTEADARRYIRSLRGLCAHLQKAAGNVDDA